MESPTIVPLIHRLVALGLVERVTTASDKRKRLLVVTDKGKALYEQVKTVADDLREEILTAITPQEQEQTPAGAGKAVARSGEEIMPRRQDNPYAPHDWAPHEKTGSARFAVDAAAQSGETPCLRRGRSAGMSHRRAGQRSGHRQPQLLQGTFAAWSTEIAWLPAVYVMTNVSINLLLVKFRQQFGLRAFTEGFCALCAGHLFFHLFVNDLSSAMMVRAAHGMVAAALSSLGIYYQVQAWPARHRLKGLTIGITGSSLAIPLARLLFPPNCCRPMNGAVSHFFELGLALVSLACVIALKLPPSDRKKVFEKKDFITFFLLAPGMALVCAVLSLGRLEWWFEAPWIGWALAAAVILIVAAITFEHNRSNPPCSIPNGFQRQHRASGHDYAVDPHRAGGAEHRGHRLAAVRWPAKRTDD